VSDLRGADAGDPNARRRGPEPRPLREVLAGVVRRPGWAPRLEGARVHGRWEEIVGDQLARHTEPVRLRAGVLVVRAESGAWATQVHYLGTQLAARANEVLGEGAVQRVSVVTGSLRGSADP
jgi:predicted nucleic acid-binding Zn ribbon protein